MNTTARDDQSAMHGPVRPVLQELPEHLQRMAAGEAPMSEADRKLIRGLLPWVAYPARPALLAPPLTLATAALLRRIFPLSRDIRKDQAR